MFNTIIHQWDKEDLIDMLNLSGYSGEDILTTEYINTVNHVSKFQISFPDEYEKGGIGYGFVFVSINDKGALVADY